jgi:hypothetical protein
MRTTPATTSTYTFAISAAHMRVQTVYITLHTLYTLHTLTVRPELDVQVHSDATVHSSMCRAAAAQCNVQLSVAGAVAVLL